MKSDNLLWLRWVVANGCGELVGLGATFAAVAWLLPGADTQRVAGVLLAFAIAVLSGSLEATVIGLAQWWAFHPWFPAIRRRAWWVATLVGALLAYVLGYLPSTLMSLGGTASQAQVAEPPQWLVLVLAAGLGAAAGAVLSFVQWRVLDRAKIEGAGWWIPANMLAWAAGMPVIFAGMDLAFAMPGVWQSVFIIAGALLIAGVAVGAIQGRFLVALVRRP